MPDKLTVTGVVKVLGLPDIACFTTFAELIQSLAQYLAVEIPASITNVIVSNVQPLDTQRNVVWFRMSNGGTFIGIYLYTDGSWRQFYPAPQEITTMYGDSRDIPEGYILTDDSNRLSSAQKTHLRLDWLRDPTDTYYTIFTVVVAPI